MTSLRSLIEQQLTELDFLRACYESTGEFHLDDAEALAEATDFLSGRIDELHRNVSFTLKIPLSESKVTFRLRLRFTSIDSPLDERRISICLSAALSGIARRYSTSNVFAA